MTADEPFFWRRLESHKGRTALIDEEGRETSYEALERASDAWRERFSALWTGDPADRLLIALAITPTVEAISAYLGALRGGHAVLLSEAAALDPAHPVCEIYRPNIVVDGAGPQLRDTTAAGLHPDLRLLLSTSGTTGAPKLVRLSNENIGSNADSIAEYLGLSPDERAMTALPLYYSYGLSVLNAHLAAGASLLLSETSVTSPRFWDVFEKHGATSLAMVPHQFGLLEATGFGSEKIPGLRYMTQAGGKLAPDLVEKFATLGRRDGWRLFVMYGQTEASPRMAYIPPDALLDNSDTIGQAIPGGRLWVMGDDGAPIEDADAPGELFYTGPNVMMGYAEQRDDLSQGQGDRTLATGDIAQKTARGFFKIVGRKKRFVKLYGLRLSLDQMEATLSGLGHRGFCMNVDDRLVVLHAPVSESSKVAADLAGAFDLPGDAVLAAPLAETPLMSSGKIDYRALQGIAEDHAAKETADKKTAGGVALREALQKATRALAVSDTDSFNTLGGDSLGYLQVTMALENRLGYVPDGWEDLPIAELERLTPRAGGGGVVTADVMARVIAVTMIVVNHLTVVWPVGGGTWVLLAIIGASIGRFGRSAVLQGQQIKAILKLLYPIIPLYFLILIAVLFAGRHVEPSMFTLTNNLGSEGSGFFVSPNWFVSLYVQVLIFLFAVLSIPAVTRFMQRDPWLLGMIALGIALAASLAFQEYARPFVEAATTRAERSFLVRSPFVCMPFVILGWLIFFAKPLDRKLMTAAAIVATCAIFPGPEWQYGYVIAAFCLFMLTDVSLSVPKPVSMVLRTAASVTMFVYLLHGVPVHIFKFELTWREDYGLAVTSLIVVLLCFGISYAAKRAFDVFDDVVFWAIGQFRARKPRAAPPSPSS